MRGFKAIRKPSTQSQSQSQSQPQPQYEIADILNRLGDKLEDLGFNGWQLRTGKFSNKFLAIKNSICLKKVQNFGFGRAYRCV